MDNKEARPSKKARSSVDSAGLTALALRLANTFSEGENIIFSPLSIYTALGLVAAGARGTTLDEILAVLGASSREEVAEVVRGVAESPRHRRIRAADHHVRVLCMASDRTCAEDGLP
jgi:serpin B